jgi:hypothetical protein
MKIILKIFLKEGKTKLERVNGDSIILNPLNHNMITMTVTDAAVPKSQVTKDFIANFLLDDIKNIEDIDHYLVID